jgi:hypothetical protein
MKGKKKSRWVLVDIRVKHFGLGQITEQQVSKLHAARRADV